ncbi:MAG: thiamine diphosphokinase [Firmicutes bacterium]|nr:thiamine diphosphokinase [Bacillota bacterium]
MKALIVGGAPINDYSFAAEYIDRNALLICADSGLLHADKMGLSPNIILGDFDSVDPKLLEKYRSSGAAFMQFPVQKDETDLELALSLCIDRGVTSLCILGAAGGRLSHTLGNAYLLIRAQKAGIDAVIADESFSLRLMGTKGRKKLILKGKKGELISLLPISGKVRGISTKGLGYPLFGESLKRGELRGVSNYMTEDICEIELLHGLLLVVKEPAEN